MDLGLADRAYVVTGGSRGLGLATAEALVADGARVVVSSRAQESVDAAVRAGASARPASSPTWPTPPPRRRLFEAARERYGRLDGALVSVGGPPAGTVARHHRRALDRGVRDRCSSERPRHADAAEELVEHGGGSIAFVLSTSAMRADRRAAISNGLRPGLAMVVDSLADELGARGVRVNAVLPGRIETDRVRSSTRQSRTPQRPVPDEPQPLGGRQPDEFGRVPHRARAATARPEELGPGGLVPLSPASSYRVIRGRGAGRRSGLPAPC